MKYPILKSSFLLLIWVLMMNGCQSDDHLNSEDWFRKGNYDQAIDDFTKALEIDSFYADAY